jgi:hypothetical protein
LSHRPIPPHANEIKVSPEGRSEESRKKSHVKVDEGTLNNARQCAANVKSGICAPANNVPARSLKTIVHI